MRLFHHLLYWPQGGDPVHTNEVHPTEVDKPKFISLYTVHLQLPRWITPIRAQVGYMQKKG